MTASGTGNISTASDDALAIKSQVYVNTTQDVIVTTEDRLRLCLMRYRDASVARGAWIGPAALFATVAAAAVTADFRSFILPSAVWHAIFVLGLVGSMIWTVVAGARALYAKTNIETVIAEVKQAPHGSAACTQPQPQARRS